MERLHLIAPATGGWFLVSGGFSRCDSKISLTRSISRENWSRMSFSLLVICSLIAPLLSMLLKFCSSSNAPSAERSLRNEVSMRLRVAFFTVSLFCLNSATTACQSSERAPSKMLNVTSFTF